MNRVTINLLASLVVLAGSWTLATPRPVAALAPEPVCCESGESECCGRECKATQSGCSACNGFWSCLFF